MPRKTKGQAYLGPNLNVYVPAAVREAILPYRDRLNLSEVFQEAVLKRIAELKENDARWAAAMEGWMGEQ